MLKHFFHKNTRTVITLVSITVILFVIDIFFILIPDYRNKIWEKKYETVRELTMIGYSLLEEYASLEKQGELTRKEAQEEAVKRLTALRYGPEMKDYYWIINLDSYMVAHPYRPDLIGKNMRNHPDPNARKIFIDAVNVAKKSKAGFISYVWQFHDNKNLIEDKTSFVKLFEPWGWIIGTGLYLNDAKADVSAYLLKATIISMLILLIIIPAMFYIIKNSAENAEVAEAYDKLKKTQTQLLHSEKMAGIGQLAAGIAHEINTPIQFIGDNLEFISDSMKEIEKILDTCHSTLDKCDIGGISPEDIQALKELHEKSDIEFLLDEIPAATTQSLEGVERISNIVRAMKNFSHPGNEEKSVIDINDSIQSTITVARNEWKYYADMNLELANDLPNVPCYPGEFNQAVLNILVNAAHAIHDDVGNSGKKGNITISTKKLETAVEIRIADDGPGIPKEIQNKVFEPFFTTKEIGKGSGQGLAITHNVIVEKHGGTLSIESEAGQGTTFIISLPTDPDNLTGSSDITGLT